jgi:uncharacterized repeat protein (TIGR01451 family)
MTPATRLARCLLLLALLCLTGAAFAQTADMSVTLSDTPDPLTLGTGNITYSATVSNNTASTATTPTLTLNAPASSTVVSMSATSGGTCNAAGTTVTCTWTSIAGPSSRTATVAVTPTAGGTLSASASVSAIESDPASANNNASTTTTVNQNIDLQVYSITDSPDPITLGTGNITYTATIYNASTSKATNPVLTLNIPAASTFVSATANVSGTCSGTTTVTCSWAGDFLSGNTRSVTLVVTPTAGGTATLTASVDGDQPDVVTSNDTASHNTTVNASIDLQIYSMTDSPDPITLGTGNITYTTTIYNSSSSKATNPVLTLSLPASSTFVSASANISGTCSGTGPVTCTWAGDFLSGNTRTVTLVVTPTAAGTATLTATVDGDQPDGTPSNDTASHNTTVNGNIDLQIYSMSDSPDPITLGTGNITYTTTIYNASTSKATNPVLTLTLPAASTFVSATANLSGTCSGTTTVVCSWAGDFPSGNTRTVTLVVTPTAGGTATLTASVDGDQPDVVTANDTASHNTTVNANIDLQVYSMSDTPDPITLGTGNITYSTTIYNASSSKATNPILTLTIPATTTFVSATANLSGTCSGTSTVTCSWAGDFTSGNTRTVTLVVTPTAGGTVTLNASVTGDQPDAATSNNNGAHSTTVNEFIDLQLYSLSDTPDPITLGTGNISYFATIYNASSSKATNPVVTFTLPAASTFVSATPNLSGTCTAPSGGVLTCSWAGDLSAGNTRSVTIIVTPTAGGTATITASVDGDQPDNVSANDSASHSTTVNEFIDLQLYSISDTPDPLTLGTGNITYYVTIYNASSSKATNAFTTITLPANTTFVSATANVSGTCTAPSGGVLTCSWAGDLTAGNTRQVTVVVTPTTGGTHTLSASVDGDQPDNVNGNDSASHSTTVNEFIDLQLYSITDTPDPITLGTGNVTYYVTIYNASTSKATNATTTITLPASATFVSATANVSGTCTAPSGGVLTCTWAGDLSAGGTRQVTVIVTPTIGGTHTLSASVDGDQPDNVNGNDAASHNTTVNANIELSLTLTDSPDPRVVGAGNVSYFLTAVNGSSSKATNPVITLTVPATTTWVSSSPSTGGSCSGSSTVTCTWADISAGSSRTASIVVTPTQVGQISATASVTSDQPDANTANNSATQTTNINPSAPPTISSFSPGSGPVGTTVTITGTNFFSTSTVRFNGVNATFTATTNTSITATVPSGATTGVLTVINASGTTNSTGTFTVTPAPNLAIAKTASSATVPTSTAFTYTLTVSNIGAGAANDVTVTDVLPGGLTLNSVSGSGWTCSGSSTITCTMGALAASGTAPAITINVTAPASGTTVTNTATVSSTTPDSSSANNSSTVSVGVVGCPSGAPITAPSTVCVNSTGHTAFTPAVPGATYAWSITNGTITSSTTSDTITFDAGATGPVTLNLSVFVTSCPTQTNSVNVAISNPTATIAASGATTFCQGGSVTLTANNGASWLWSNGATTQSVVISASETLTVTVTDAAGCSATSAPTSVTVNPAPTATITAGGPTTFCDGGSVTLNAPAGMSSYSWSNGANTPSIVVTQSGSYSVSITDASGCSANSAAISVTVLPPPAATITASGPTTFCDGGNVTLTAPAGMTTYAWSNGASTQSIVVNDSNTYSVTVTNASGCSATSAAVTTTELAPASVTITGPSTACGSASLDAGAGWVSYLWNTSATTQSITVTTSGTYSVTVTDANGCQVSDTHVINVTAAPPVTISGPASTCATTPVTLDAGSGYASYSWNTGATTQAITASTSGTYTVTVTDANGCVGSASHVLTVNPTPNATITASGPTTFCDGGSVTLTAPPAATYAWSNGEQTQSITVTASGTFIVTVTDGNGCTATSAPKSVSVNPNASVTITGPSTACSTTPAVLDAGAGFASYLWSNGATTQTINVTASGTYSVTVTNAGGCSATDTHTVTVTPTPTAIVTASGPTTFCSGGSVTLTSSPAPAYDWSNGATTQSITVTSGGAYTVTTTDGACSTTSAPVTVTVHPSPNAAITVPGFASANATVNASVAAQPGAFTWTVTNGSITSGQGTTSISVTVSNGSCASSDVRTMTILGAPPASADLAITKTAPPSVAPNGTIVYMLTIANHGPATATDVTVRDVLPAGVAFVNVNGGAFSCGRFGSEVVCTGSLLSGTSSAISITTTATQTSGSIANTANVTAGTSDPNPLNDSASAVTQIVTSNECPAIAPQLTSPAQNATASSPVTFTWTAVAGATGYRLWIEVNGTAPQELGTTIDATTVTTSVPPGAIVAYVDALFANCPATRGARVSFNVPPVDRCGQRTPATLVAPANDATVNSSTVEFTWTSGDAAEYRLWLSRNGAPAIVLTTTNATSFRTNLEPGLGEWWIEKLYEGCASVESQHFRFTVPQQQNCGTARPELLSPVGVNVTSAAQTFQWTSVASATAYELWLSVDSGTPTLAGTTTSTSLEVTVPPGTLDWFVRALVDRCPSRDSQPAAFVYTPPASCANTQRATPIAPLPNAQLTSPVDFAWTAATNASRYELFVDDVLVASTTNTFANDVALPNGAARWFVRTHFNGCAALDSAEEKLVIVPTPAACSELVPPVIAAAGQISSGVPFLIQWNHVAGATSYELQLASTPAFSDAQVVATGETKHELVRTAADTPVAIYARVRALDARCQPVNVTAFGPSTAIFILPVTGTEGSAPLTGGTVSSIIHLGPEFAGQSFAVSVKDPWLTVSPTAGTVAANGTKLTVLSDTTLLPLGTSLGTVTITLETPSAGNVASHGTTINIPTVSISKVTPVTPSLKSTPPPDALIIPAVAHANGINSQFQSDVRVTNSSAQLMQYQLSFTPTGDAGALLAKQTQFSIEPGRTIALDDILKSWFGTGSQSVTGTLEVRPVTQTSNSISGVHGLAGGLLNLSTFASSRTFNKTANGTFGQYIPAIPYANFVGKDRVLSLQQIAQSSQYRTNLGIVEGSGEAVSLMIKVFGNTGQKLTEFPLSLKGGEHTQLNAFLATRGIDSLSDGRVEIQVLSPGGKVTAYASVLDSTTNDPLLVAPTTLSDEGNTKWVMPGVADLDNGTANWQTDMRVFNAGTTDVDATLTFYSQNGGAPKTAHVRIPAGQVQQLDRTLANTFGVSNDGGAVHIATPSSARLVTTARTYNQTSGGTYGQFISAVTANEAAGVGNRPLQLLQVEESSRFRSNIGLAEVTGQAVKIEITVVPPDAKFSAVTQLELQPNEFRQLTSLLRSVGLTDTYNARVTVRAIEGAGRVTAYASVIDMITNDPTLIPAQ